MICTYYGYTITPDKLNTELKGIKGFVSGGLYVWGSITNIYPLKEKKIDTPSALTDAQISTIKTSIDKGYPVMLQIDFKPSTSALDMHYVVAIDYSDNDFTVADPIDGTIKLLSKYSTDIRKVIWQFVVYEGEIPSQVSQEDYDKIHDELDAANTQISDLKAKVRELKKEIDSKDNAYQALKTLCETLESKRNDLEAENSTLGKDLEEVTDQLSSTLAMNLDLQKTIDKLRNKQPEYTAKEINEIVKSYLRRRYEQIKKS